jgi:hypothetical protein
LDKEIPSPLGEAWEEEIERRRQEVRQGKAKPLAGEEVSRKAWGMAYCELVTPRLRDYSFRNMSVAASIVLEGLLKPDGTLELRGRPVFPPGRVRVTLEAIKEHPVPRERLPEPPWREESIPAPFDLPPPLRVKGVQAHEAAERPPDPLQWSDEARP